MGRFRILGHKDKAAQQNAGIVIIMESYYICEDVFQDMLLENCLHHLYKSSTFVSHDSDPKFPQKSSSGAVLGQDL